MLHLIVGRDDTDWHVKDRSDTVHATGFATRVKESYSNVSMRATGLEGERWYGEVLNAYIRSLRFIHVY